MSTVPIQIGQLTAAVDGLTAEVVEDRTERQAHVADAEAARNLAQAAKDKAQDWAEEAEDTEVEAGQYSARHHALKAAASATTAGNVLTDPSFVAVSADLLGDDTIGTVAALAPDVASVADIAAAQRDVLASVSGGLSSTIGQTWREVARLAEALPALEGEVDAAVAGVQADFAAVLGAAITALTWAGQIADQVNGGRVALAGGNAADPALRIGTAGVYSSAADTLSISIAGTEVARFTSAGLTIFGTVTEA